MPHQAILVLAGSKSRPLRLAVVQGRAAGGLDSDAVRVPHEELVVVVVVPVDLRRKVDPSADVEAALVRGVDLFARVDVERQVLDANVVVVVLPAVRRPEAQQGVAEAEVDDLFGAAVTRVALELLEARRPEHGEIEGKRPLDIAHGEINVVNPAGRHYDSFSNWRRSAA
jgi:hypothetical protein